MIPVDEMTLWFSGKEMQRGKLLADSIGRNEKTTMIVKIQKVRKGVYSTICYENMFWLLLERKQCTSS